MIETALSIDPSSAAESAQAVLQTGARFLLTLSMGLFVSYLLFILGAVAVSALVNLVGSARTRLAARADVRAPTAQPRRALPAGRTPRAGRRTEARAPRPMMRGADRTEAPSIDDASLDRARA